MSRTLVCALALSALVLSPAIATAKSGSGGGGVTSSRGGSVPAARQQHTDNRPHVGFKKMRILYCGKYPRGDGHGGVIMVTVCTKS